MIEVRHLRYFLAAAEHGSFRKAAAALGIQESAVSRRVRTSKITSERLFFNDVMEVSA